MRHEQRSLWYRTNSGTVVIAAIAAVLGGCGSRAAAVESKAPSANVPLVAFATPTTGAAAAAPAPAPAEKPKEEATPEEMVARCTTKGDSKSCTLADDSIANVCRRASPTTAVRIFEAGAKTMTRAWLRGDVEAWSSVRHARATKAKASFDEEVLILREVHSHGGIVSTGAAASYEVLRWNGTCASLSSGELSFKRPPNPNRPIDLSSLDQPTRTWLEHDASVKKTETARLNACADNAVTLACKKASEARDAAIGRVVLSSR